MSHLALTLVLALALKKFVRDYTSLHSSGSCFYVVFCFVLDSSSYFVSNKDSFNGLSIAQDSSMTELEFLFVEIVDQL